MRKRERCLVICDILILLSVLSSNAEIKELSAGAERDIFDTQEIASFTITISPEDWEKMQPKRPEGLRPGPPMPPPAGVIWAGTMGGMSRYNGKKWQFYAGTIQGWTDIDMNERRLRRGVGGGAPGERIETEYRNRARGGPDRPGLVPIRLRVSIRHFAPTQPRFLNPPRLDQHPLPLPDLKQVQYTG